MTNGSVGDMSGMNSGTDCRADGEKLAAMKQARPLQAAASPN
jgi:hypothetical protein